jgi:hypothetical protein
MSYSDFTIDLLKEKFGVKLIENCILFPNPRQSEVPALLPNLLKRYAPLATMINTEKARSELIIAPVLAEFRLKSENRVSLFSGIEFNVDPNEGLNERCDFILSKSEEQLVLNAPVVMIVEAKNDNIMYGIPQCLAGMIGAMQFNRLKQNEIETVYGIVTTGSLWKFLKLQSDNVAYIDLSEYHIQNLDKIIGILDEMISA